MSTVQAFVFPRPASTASPTTTLGSQQKGTSSSSKVIFTFDEARKLARARAHSSIEEFLEYDCAGAYVVPKNVDEIYAASWQGWGDFLGLMYDYDEARTVLKALGCASESAYKEMHASNPRLPAMPDKFYKSDWKGFETFLGTEDVHH